MYLQYSIFIKLRFFLNYFSTAYLNRVLLYIHLEVAGKRGFIVSFLNKIDSNDIIWKIAFLLIGAIFGGIVTRYFTLKDRKSKKLKLKVIKNVVKSAIPLEINKKQYKNLASMAFILKNKTNTDFEALNLILEFETGSKILRANTTSEMHGTNNYVIRKSPPNRILINITLLKRKKSVNIEIDLANFSKRSFKGMVDNPGVDVKIV